MRMPGFIVFLTTSVIVLCFSTLIQNFVVNFADLSVARNDLIVNKCRQISSFHYTRHACYDENKQLQNINTKPKWRSVVPSCYIYNINQIVIRHDRCDHIGNSIQTHVVK